MRVGLVGVGRIGAAHAQVLRRHPDVGTLVLTDADTGHARAVAEKLGAEAVDSVEQVLDGADALVVAAPTAAHGELILRGVRAGIPVFCEKPLTGDIASSVDVCRQVEDSGVDVHIGFHRRFDPGFVAAREALSAGLLGELRRVHLVSADAATPAAQFIAGSGGIFRDCHVHDIDVLRWATGREVVEVYAIGAARGEAYVAEADDVDESAALLTMDDGTLVTLQGSRCNGGGYDARMELAGTLATHVAGLDPRSPLVSAEPGVSFPDGSAWPTFWERFEPAFTAELNAFCDLVLGRRENPCTVRDALETFVVAEAADRSRRERRPVAVAQVRPA